MRRFILPILFLLFFPFIASAGFSNTDKGEIRQNIKIIEQSLEKGDIADVTSLISPNASPNLKNEIEDNLRDKKIHFTEDDISSWDNLSSSSVKIKGSFSASGSDWKISGMGNYFIFEKVKGRWLLLDTDFYQKLSPEFWWKFIKKIMVFAFPIFILTSAFWIWMLVDCLNKSSKDKLIWVLVIIFLNILGAVLYFFIERKKIQQLNKEQ
jgi:hypothetical protein